MNKPTPEQVRITREKASLTQRQCANIFGYSIRAWQSKEDAGPSGRSLTIGEWNYLQLLAGIHPDKIIINRN